MKIYTDDPNLPYKTTHLNSLQSKTQIDGLFAKWGIKKTAWNFDPDHNNVYVLFEIEENIEDKPMKVSAKVEAPVIWDHRTRNKAEQPNWNISMRVLFWFLKSHLEAAYLRQSSKTSAFLPYIVNKHDQTVSEILIPRLSDLEHLAALPVEQDNRKHVNTVEAECVAEPREKEEDY